MKKKLLTLLSAICLLAVLTVPALAARDYGLTYDATGLMDESFMQSLADDTFQTLTDKYGVQVRLDIVDGLEGNSIRDYAALFYDQYDYGYEGTDDGVLLMLYLYEDDTGLACEDFCILPGGRAETLLTTEQLDTLYTTVASTLNQTSMSGGLTEDQAACETTLLNYAAALDSALAAAGAADSVPAAVPEPVPADTGEADARLDHVTDTAGLLTDGQAADLESRAAQMSQQYGCGTYIVTVDDYEDYTDGSVRQCAEEIFTDYDLGYGDSRDGVLLLMSMAERDYALIAHGDFGNAAFTDYGKDVLTDAFLDDFRYDNWYDGFSDYLDVSGDMMSAARSGNPVDVDNGGYDGYDGGSSGSRVTVGSVCAIVIIALLVALIVSMALKKKMKSARTQVMAEEYVIPQGVVIDVREDSFSHRTEVREVIESKSKGGTTVNLGGFSGKSGKF